MKINKFAIILLRKKKYERWKTKRRFPARKNSCALNFWDLYKDLEMETKKKPAKFLLAQCIQVIYQLVCFFLCFLPQQFSSSILWERLQIWLWHCTCSTQSKQIFTALLKQNFSFFKKKRHSPHIHKQTRLVKARTHTCINSLFFPPSLWTT